MTDEEIKKLEKRLDKLLPKYTELENKMRNLRIEINQIYSKLDGSWQKKKTA